MFDALLSDDEFMAAAQDDHSGDGDGGPPLQPTAPHPHHGCQGLPPPLLRRQPAL